MNNHLNAVLPRQTPEIPPIDETKKPLAASVSKASKAASTVLESVLVKQLVPKDRGTVVDAGQTRKQVPEDSKKLIIALFARAILVSGEELLSRASTRLSLDEKVCFLGRLTEDESSPDSSNSCLVVIFTSDSVSIGTLPYVQDLTRMPLAEFERRPPNLSDYNFSEASITAIEDFLPSTVDLVPKKNQPTPFPTQLQQMVESEPNTDLFYFLYTTKCKGETLFEVCRANGKLLMRYYNTSRDSWGPEYQFRNALRHLPAHARFERLEINDAHDFIKLNQSDLGNSGAQI